MRSPVDFEFYGSETVIVDLEKLGCKVKGSNGQPVDLDSEFGDVVPSRWCDPLPGISHPGVSTPDFCALALQADEELAGNDNTKFSSCFFDSHSAIAPHLTGECAPVELDR